MKVAINLSVSTTDVIVDGKVGMSLKASPQPTAQTQNWTVRYFAKNYKYFIFQLCAWTCTWLWAQWENSFFGSVIRILQ